MPSRPPVLAALAALVLALLALGPAAASPYAYYAERQRGETLTIKHSPAPGIVVRNVRVKKPGLVRHRVIRHRVVRHRAVARRHVRRRGVVRVANVRDPAIAGFCRDGGAWLKPRPPGRPMIVQKEVCESVAHYSLNPNDRVVRPDKSSLLPF
jgi:hypothetical protein